MDADDIVLVEGARTPIGSFCGSLKDQSAIGLGVVASQGALQRSGVSPQDVDQVIFGNVGQSSPDAIYLARHIGLKVGCKVETPALIVNRLCGSGLQAVISAAEQIQLGEARIVLAGGTENMSQLPHVIRGARTGLPMGHQPLEDYLRSLLEDSYVGCGMGMTAENLAAMYNLSRKEVDQVAYTSQMRAKAGWESGRLAEEVVPVPLKEKKEAPLEFARDEHFRPQTTPETLATLRPIFKQDGVVSAGNASGISDGAAALVVTSLQVAQERGLKPLGRILAWGVAGVPPEIMGIGPVPASQQAIQKAGLTLDQMDLVEINEAFAAQYLAVKRELRLDPERTNVNGCAIALGHPLGCSGARVLLTILYELRRRGGGRGLAAACIGGGQGIAVIVEAPA
jgi:acetyl-CoA acetyltransferase family protein